MTTTDPRSALPVGAAPPSPAEGTADAVAAALPGRVARLIRGHDDWPAWARPASVALLVATAALYCWNLTSSGWANSFYSAAVQAGSVSWKAFFFGSSDAANSITVDKPPLALWPMALSVRLFGLSSFSILLPQALMGVASVGVLNATVRRRFGAAAGLVAGAILALTPVAALMFRFNNPDALLTLLLVLAAGAAILAVETGRTRWFVATGVAVGLGFLTKQLQVMLVVPGFALAHLAFGDGKLVRRLRDLLVAGLAMIAAAGWWVAIVELIPASMRPYIGGSQENSILELTFGYNGLGRLTGDEVGSVGGGGPGGAGGNGGGMWGETGLWRMFRAEVGGQISWLIPAALLLAAAGLVVIGRARRTDARRVAIAVWGSWLVVTALVFSFMSGIFHAYYTIALAPAVAALVAIGGALLWPHRRHPAALATFAAVTAVTTWWARHLLGQASTWNPWLSTVVLVTGTLAVAGFLCAAALGRLVGDRATGRLAAGALVLAGVAGLAGPTAWTLQTVSTGHQGSIVAAGPQVAGSFGPGGGMPAGGMPAGGVNGGGMPGPGMGLPPGGLPGGGMGLPPGGFGTNGAGGTAGTNGTTGANGTAGPGGMGGPGGLLGSTEPSEELRQVLEADADEYTWIAAAVGANNAAGYQLATELPVMPLGGFNGSDPSPTLDEFQEYVADGEIHWFIGSGGGFGAQMGGSRASSEIASWVAEHFASTTVDGTTLYDLTDPL